MSTTEQTIGVPSDTIRVENPHILLLSLALVWVVVSVVRRWADV